MHSRDSLFNAILLTGSVIGLLFLLSVLDAPFEFGGIHFQAVKPWLNSSSHKLTAKRLTTKSAEKTNTIASKAIVDSSLFDFYTAMRKYGLQQKKIIRIGYFGDSMIEGDLITEDLRAFFQDSLGGNGVGFLPITSIAAPFRKTIFQQFSKDWRTFSLKDKKNPSCPLGISGFSFNPNINSWVKLSTPNNIHLNSMAKIQLFYGKGSKKNFVHCDSSTFSLNGMDEVNKLEIMRKAAYQPVQLNFLCAENQTVFGLNIEGDSGIYVHNFSLRGNSGLPLIKIPANILRQFNEKMPFDLIILHYGINVLNSEQTQFDAYQKGMVAVIQHLQLHMPHTSILLVGTGDKATIIDGELQTDPSIPFLISAQKSIAKQTHIGFFDLFEKMGGNGTMIKWVDSSLPPLASKDYTHPNALGAKKLAVLIHHHLIAACKAYELQLK